MKIKIQYIVTALILAFGNLNASSPTSNGIQPPLLTSGEWVSFKAGKGLLNAIRIVDQNGNEGSWVGDAMRGIDAAKAQSLFAQLKGIDLSNPDATWDILVNKKLPVPFLNALDIAVWDLYGRTKNQPVGKLLGETKRDRVKLYLSGFPNMTQEQNVQSVKDAAERKIQAYRIYAYLKGTGPVRNNADAIAAGIWLESDIQLARAVKAAAPEGLPLMFYPGCSYNPEQAAKVGAELDKLGYVLFLDPMNSKGAEMTKHYEALRDKLKTPLCAPIEGGLSLRLEWVKNRTVQMLETDIYGGFTPCVRLIRACEKAGVPLDLHAGFPTDMYQFPLYGFVSDATLPWIGWHGRSPKGIAVATNFSGTEVKPVKFPWLKCIQTRPVDADGFVHLAYEIPGMGLEADWEWIRAHRK